MEATITEILDARERRVQRQQALLEEYGMTLLCFTLNIPGPDKTTELAEKGFALGNRLLHKVIPQEKCRHFEQRCTAAGWESFYAVDMPAQELKRITAALEDKTPAGRVFDMDVLTPSGEKVQRQQLWLPPRKCLLCDQSAAVCGRSRAHSVGQLVAATDALLKKGISRYLGDLALQSIFSELYATPKPGLVDQSNSGSHQDMDLYTFLRSGAALHPYFCRCAQIGLEGGEPAAVFDRLRQAGLEAEQRMLRATGGINTHKGAIFTMGILCGAAAMLPGSQWKDPAALQRQCALLAKGLVRKDFEFMKQPGTAGERLFEQYGITGARGQAEAGFPAACTVGLPVLEEGLEKGLSFNDALCAALLHIIATTWDTNLIKRGGMAAYGQIKAVLQMLLQAQPFPPRSVLEDLDKAFIKQNLSPGGSADLLAATCFFYLLKA